MCEMSGVSTVGENRINSQSFNLFIENKGYKQARISNRELSSNHIEHLEGFPLGACVYHPKIESPSSALRGYGPNLSLTRRLTNIMSCRINQFSPGD